MFLMTLVDFVNNDNYFSKSRGCFIVFMYPLEI
jgi:hypothetical protein